MNYKKWLKIILKSAVGILLLFWVYGVVIVSIDENSTPEDALVKGRVKVLSETHYLYDDKIKRTLSSRVIVANEFDGVIYALTYEGYIVYHPNEGILKKYKGNNNGLVNDLDHGVGSYRKMLNWTELATFDEFTAKEKDGFTKMFQTKYYTDQLYTPPYYSGAYTRELIDTDPRYMVYLTNMDKYKIKMTCFI